MQVYSAFFAGTPKGYGYKPFLGQGYSNRSAVGTAVGDEPETLVAVFGGRYYNDMCCFGAPVQMTPFADKSTSQVR